MKPTIRRRPYSPTSLIAPMLDLFLLSLCIVLMKQPAFGLRDLPVPPLVVHEHKDQPVGTALGHAPIVVLKADGTALWKGKEIALADLPSRIAAETKAEEEVRVVVEIGIDGAGPVRVVLEFQIGCARERITERLRLVCRPTEVRS